MRSHPVRLLIVIIIGLVIGVSAAYSSHLLLKQSHANHLTKMESLASLVGKLKQPDGLAQSSSLTEDIIDAYLTGSEFDCVSIQDQVLALDRDWPNGCLGRLDLRYAYVYKSDQDVDLKLNVYVLRTHLFTPIFFEVAGYTTLALAVLLLIFTLGQARRRQLENLQEELSRISSAKLKETIYASLDAVITMDEGGCCADFNPSAERIFGFKRDEIVGQRIGDVIVPEEYRAAHANGLARFRKSQVSEIAGKRLELQALRKNGEMFAIEMVIQVIGFESETSFVAFIRDTSEEKRIAAEREDALLKAEGALQTKSDFVATISHEIRTPLNGVLGVLSLLHQTKIDAEQKKYVEVGRRSGEMLLQLINDILDFTKIEAGKLELDIAPFFVVDIVKCVTEMLDSEARLKKIQLHVECELDDTVRVFGDAGRLQQVLVNILGNAIKFTEVGRVTLSVVEISPTSSKERHLLFTCLDTGVGIAHDKQPNIFEKFNSSKPIGSAVSQGSGLGLAISRELLSLMGGAIAFESTPGIGSKFWFSVPFPAVDEFDTSPQVRSNSPPLEVFLPLLSKQVLLAEDNPTNSMIARVMLEKAGHSVYTVADGFEALQAVKNFRFDAVFMDISMPIMDGLEATTAIRSLPDDQGSLPIIALTAHVLEKEKDRLFDVGMDDFISKPVSQNMLLETLKKWTPKEIEPGQEPLSIVNENNGAAESILNQPVFDAAVLQGLLNDTSQDAFLKLIVSFRQSLVSSVSVMKDAIEVQDAAALDHEAHALGSSVGAFGGQRLFALCRAICFFYAKGEHDRAIEMALGIEQLADKTLVAIESKATELV
ncbi:MAG: response regulator [Pseudomonadales bacterium]|nr:response regulator [Pseudomonadales bacterium]MDG1443061.1 response regulator [Pseudomonadales bacterium]